MMKRLPGFTICSIDKDGAPDGYGLMKKDTKRDTEIFELLMANGEIMIRIAINLLNTIWKGGFTIFLIHV